MSPVCGHLVGKARYQSIWSVVDGKSFVCLPVVVILIKDSSIAWTCGCDIKVGDVIGDGLTEGVADQEAHAAGPALLDLHLEAVVIQVPDAVLELDLAEIRIREGRRQPSRLRIP